MEEKMKRVLSELLLDGRESDRCLAEKVYVSQPTVGKIRRKLEDEGYISGYSIMPILSKMDVELISFIAIKWKDYKKVQDLKNFESFVQNSEMVFFAAPGEGLQDKTKIIITFHRDYRSYEFFLRELRADFTDVIETMDTFIVSTDNILKNFNFNGLKSML